MTSAERRQYEGWERRRAAWDEAVRLQAKGMSIKAIARGTRLGPGIPCASWCAAVSPRPGGPGGVR